MFERQRLLFLLVFISVFLASVPVLNADLGMVAGSLNFNVSVGSHQTLQFKSFNTGDSPINFQVVPPTYKQIPNQTTPTLVISPMNGTMAPHSEITFNVTVYMPWNDKPKDFWDNIAQVVAVSNTSSVGGATVFAGVGKEITITSAPSTINFALIYVTIAIVVIIVLISVYYLLVYKKKAAVSRAASRRANTAQKRSVRAKRGKRTAKRSGKKSKTTRKGSRRRRR